MLCRVTPTRPELVALVLCRAYCTVSSTLWYGTTKSTGWIIPSGLLYLVWLKLSRGTSTHLELVVIVLGGSYCTGLSTLWYCLPKVQGDFHISKITLPRGKRRVEVPPPIRSWLHSSWVEFIVQCRVPGALVQQMYRVFYFLIWCQDLTYLVL